MIVLLLQVGLYAQSFGTLSFPFTIDLEANGGIDVTIDDVDGMLLSKPQLQDYLAPVLTDELLDKLAQLPLWVSVENLAAIGIETVIDETALTVNITINPKKKAIVTTSLISTNSPITSSILEPADFSFYINFFADSELNLSTFFLSLSRCC